ncbi:MAG: hypothetical protein QME78_11400 [Thermodesulfobacteriota bacterium]|nr:hypothetical protein [Thermodesulfobacteriota bacterium]
MRPTKKNPPSIKSEGEYMNMKGMIYAERPKTNALHPVLVGEALATAAK